MPKYAAIDIHNKDGTMWPAVVPALTAYEAERVVRRLYRFALGRTFEGHIEITSGNRRATRLGWKNDKRCFYINPEQGWRDLVHELSHDFDYLANGESKHTKHHERFETRMIKEVFKRGWLTGKLLQKWTGVPVNPIDAKLATLRAKLASIEARQVNWQRKQQRAENALRKVAKELRTVQRAIDNLATSPAAAPVTAKPRGPTPQTVMRELAKAHGIEIESMNGGWNVWPPSDPFENDLYDGDHFAQSWGEVKEHVQAYVDLIKQAVPA